MIAYARHDEREADANYAAQDDQEFIIIHVAFKVILTIWMLLELILVLIVVIHSHRPLQDRRGVAAAVRLTVVNLEARHLIIGVVDDLWDRPDLANILLKSADDLALVRRVPHQLLGYIDFDSA